MKQFTEYKIGNSATEPESSGDRDWVVKITSTAPFSSLAEVIRYVRDEEGIPMDELVGKRRDIIQIKPINWSNTKVAADQRDRLRRAAQAEL